MKNLYKSLLVAFCLIGLLPNINAQAQKSVGKADLYSQLNYNNKVLKYKGGGIRGKFIFDIYSIGLYLEKDMNDPLKVMEADEPMGLQLEITSTLLSKEKLYNAFMKGFHRATEGDTKQYEKRIEDFLTYMNSVEVGDSYDLVYIPNEGTSIYFEGKRRTTIKGLDFKQKLFAIWLGTNAVNKGLKKEMMGR